MSIFEELCLFRQIQRNIKEPKGAGSAWEVGKFSAEARERYLH